MKKIQFLATVACISACLCASAMSVSAANLPPPDAELSDSELEVFDKDSTWSTSSHIDLFARNELGNQVLYPGIKGEYSFTVNNRSLHDREVEVVIDDTNDFDIPLDIRMSRDGVYVLGAEDSYVNSADYDSGIYKIDLEGQSVYKIEWKWDLHNSEKEDSRDTELGVAAHYKDLPYYLNIIVYGEQDVIEQSESEPEPSPDPDKPVSHPEPSPEPPSPPDDKTTVLTGDIAGGIVVGAMVCVAASLVIVFLTGAKRKKEDETE